MKKTILSTKVNPAVLPYLDEKIEQLEQQVKATIDSHPDLKRKRDLLVSIKGIRYLLKNSG